MKTLRALVAGLPAAFWVLFFGMLVNRMGNFVGPMLTFYLHGQRGVPLSVAGAMVSLWGIGSVLGAAAGGMAADRLGRRATLKLFLPLAALAMLVFGELRALPLIALGAFTTAFLSDAVRPPVSAATADVVPDEDRARAYGLLYLAANLGFAVAPSVAGWIAPWSWRALFIGDAVTTLLFLVFVVRWLPETSAPAKLAGVRVYRGGSVAPSLPFVWFCLLTFLSSLVPYATAVPLAGLMFGAGLGPRDYGTVVALNGLLIVIVQPFVTQRLAMFDPARLLAVSALVMGVGVGLHGVAEGLPGHVLAILVWTAGEIVGAGSGATLVAKLAPREARGRYQGWFNASWSLASCVAPWLGGTLMERFGAATPFAGAAVLGVVVCVGFFGWNRAFGERTPDGEAAPA